MASWLFLCLLACRLPTITRASSIAQRHPDDADPPPNDYCPGATELQVDFAPILGTTKGASSERVYQCRQRTCDADSTNYLDLLGVWYKIRGNGQGMSASTCIPTGALDLNTRLNYRGFIKLFEGKCSSNEQEGGGRNQPYDYDKLSTQQLIRVASYTGTCVEDDPGIFSVGYRLDWVSELGTTYYIFVYDGSPTFSSGSDFYVSVSSLQDLAPNDQCGNAESLSIASSENFTSPQGSVAVDVDVPIFSCFFYPLDIKGTWYMIKGNGGAYRVETDSGVVVFAKQQQDEFASCENDLLCMAVSERWGLSASYKHVTFVTEVGRYYYIHLRSIQWLPITDNGRLRIRQVTPPENYRCESAIELIFRGLPSNQIVGNLENAPVIPATPSSSLPSSAVSQMFSFLGTDQMSGVFYTVQGTGESMELNFCHNETNVAPRVSIFRKLHKKRSNENYDVNGNQGFCDMANLQLIYSETTSEIPGDERRPTCILEGKDQFFLRVHPICWKTSALETYLIHVGMGDSESVGEQSKFGVSATFGMSLQYSLDRDCYRRDRDEHSPLQLSAGMSAMLSGATTMFTIMMTGLSFYGQL